MGEVLKFFFYDNLINGMSICFYYIFEFERFLYIILFLIVIINLVIIVILGNNID